MFIAKKIKKKVYFLLLFLFSNITLAHDIHGLVVNVIDGDTVWILDDHKHRIKVRLWGIDAPEMGQPWGKQSKKALNKKMQHQNVIVEVKDADKYGRSVGIIYNDKNQDINQWMVRTGHAWIYTYYNKDKYYADQAAAQAEQKGLWRLPKTERMPPWQWRKLHS